MQLKQTLGRIGLHLGHRCLRPFIHRWPTSVTAESENCRQRGSTRPIVPHNRYRCHKARHFVFRFGHPGWITGRNILNYKQGLRQMVPKV